MRSNRKRSWDGFTTVEITFTLVLLAVLVALGVGRVDSSTWQLDAAGLQVVQEARAARTLAVLKQHDVIVAFDVNARQISIHEDADGDGEQGEGERVIRHTLKGHAAFTPGEAPAYAGFSAGPITFDGGSVTFRRNGSASQEGVVYVGRAGLTVARAVVIGRATGFAEMIRYDGTNWSSN